MLQQPTTIRPVNMTTVMIMQEEMAVALVVMVMTVATEMVLEMDLVPRDIRVPVLEKDLDRRMEALNLVPTMDLRAVEMDKAAAATPKVTRDPVPDRVLKDIKVPVLMMETDLAPRDTKEAVDMDLAATEMEAVPRDIRAVVPETAMETEVVPREALSLVLTMDTLEVATMEEMAVEMVLDPRDTRAVALEMVMAMECPRVPVRALDLILMMVTLEVATAEETVVDLAITTVVDPY